MDVNPIRGHFLSMMDGSTDGVKNRGKEEEESFNVTEREEAGGRGLEFKDSCCDILPLILFLAEGNKCKGEESSSDIPVLFPTLPLSSCSSSSLVGDDGGQRFFSGLSETPRTQLYFSQTFLLFLGFPKLFLGFSADSRGKKGMG